MLPSLLLLLAIARADPPEGSAPADDPVEEPADTGSAPAHADEAEQPVDEAELPVDEAELPVDEDELPPFADQLEQAKALYFQGEHDDALEVLEALHERLREGEQVPDPQRDDALLYLGEVQYLLGDRAAAWRTFEWLLRRDPDVVMSTFEHPGEVVHWFSLVQQRVRQELARQVPEEPPPPPPIPALPAWGYAPFGIPQFVRGDAARGWVLGGLQAALGATSVASFVYLVQVNREDHPTRFTEPDLIRHVNVMRFAVQWPATLGFWGTWLGSHLEARNTWRADHAPQVSVTVRLDPARPSLWIVGRF